MTQYIIRRFLQMIPITLGILTLIFSLIHLIPGDPAMQIAGDGARPEDVQRIRTALGLDQPLWKQYVTYLGNLAKGDLGRSFRTNESVAKEIAARYPATIQLAMGAMFVALLVAFPLGIISAIYRNTWIDNVARFFALIGVSMPSFWFGPLLIIAFSIKLQWFPVSGREEGLKSMVLPSLTMGLALAAILTRMIRVSLAEELNQLYVTTAIAKVVGITDFCIFPPALDRPRLGGTKNPRVDEIRALRPDLVHMNLEENLRRHAEAIETFAPVFVSEPKSVLDVVALITGLGQLHGRVERAAQLVDELQNELTSIPARAFTFACPIWKEPWMWCGGDTYVSNLVESTGGRNVLADRDRYPQLALEDVLALRPDIVFLPDEPFVFTEEDRKTIRGPRVVGPFPGHLFTWHGTRTTLGLRFLRSV